MKLCKCRHCNESIRFIETVSGKLLPVNKDPVYYFVAENFNTDRIVTSDGHVLACRISKDPTDNMGFEPHFGYCSGMAGR